MSWQSGTPDPTCTQTPGDKVQMRDFSSFESNNPQFGDIKFKICCNRTHAAQGTQVKMESLEDKLASLKGELKYYEQQIYQQVSAINSSLSSAISQEIDLKSDPRNAIPLLQNDVNALLKEAHKTKAYVAANKETLDECASLVDTMKYVVSLAELISKCEDAVNTYDITNAAILVQELKNKLQDLPKDNTEIGSGAVCSHLRRESQVVVYRQQARLKRLIQHCISVEKGRIVINKVLKGMLQEEEIILQEPLALSSVWTAIITADETFLQEIVDSLVSDVWMLIMVPLWKERKAQAPRVNCGDEVSALEFEAIANGMATDSSSQSDAGHSAVAVGACKMPFHQLLELVSSVLNFVWSEMFASMEAVSSIRDATMIWLLF
jgi:hypothetical protein